MKHRYAILMNPGHNRVYFEQAGGMAAAEFEIAASRMRGTFEAIKIESIAGVPYLVFDNDGELSDADAARISRLSFAYTVFERVQADGRHLLSPIACESGHVFDTDIASMLKYSGKTNEVFTRMMLNVALMTSDYSRAENIHILDPVAGKGTTLFEGAMNGFNATGIEITERPVHEAQVFFKKFLEKAKYKHSYHKDKIGGGKQVAAMPRHAFEYAQTKDDMKTGGRTLTMIVGDSSHIGACFKKNTFHLIVGDLPYGVSHGNVAGAKTGGKTRSPSALLDACLPGWLNALMPGGAMVLAWNTFVMPRAAMIEAIERGGFLVMTDAAYTRFEHRVDQAIKRDIIVARKV